MNDIPIVVLSFDRPQYLAPVLDSLAAQTALGNRPVYLFQDNAVNAYSGNRYADDANIARCVDVFRERFPHGTVMMSDANIGVCENFLRAERFVFNELNAETAYFFEDDLVLSPHYLTMIDRVAEWANGIDRIGYFAAYGRFNDPEEKRLETFTHMQRLAHHWGFALKRKHWLDLDAWMQPYYNLVVGRDYRQRPTPEILAYFRERDIPVNASSQDDVKKVGTYMLGRVSVNTLACYAKYIGEYGLHMRPQAYREGKYEATVMRPEPTQIKFPTLHRLDEYHAKELENRWRVIDPSRLPPAPAGRKGAGTARPVIERLFGGDVYSDPLLQLAPDFQGWNSKHRAIRQLILDRRPRVVFDVGVWKGLSTIFMAETMRENGIDACIVAIDTFLGAPEHWNRSREDVFASLRLRNGFPLLYYQFLSNVVASHVEDFVVPLPQTSENAAVILKRAKIVPDLVHIDAAHEYEAVRRDIEVYYEMLRPGGTLLGDDFKWPGVARAATEFAQTHGLELVIDEPKWYVRKPLRPAANEGVEEKGAAPAVQPLETNR